MPELSKQEVHLSREPNIEKGRTAFDLGHKSLIYQTPNRIEKAAGVLPSRAPAARLGSMSTARSASKVEISNELRYIQNIILKFLARYHFLEPADGHDFREATIVRIPYA